MAVTTRPCSAARTFRHEMGSLHDKGRSRRPEHPALPTDNGLGTGSPPAPHRPGACIPGRTQPLLPVPPEALPTPGRAAPYTSACWLDVCSFLNRLSVFPQVFPLRKQAPPPAARAPPLPTLVSGALPVGNLGQGAPAQDQGLPARGQEDGGHSPSGTLQPQAAPGFHPGHPGRWPKGKRVEVWVAGRLQLLQEVPPPLVPAPGIPCSR